MKHQLLYKIILIIYHIIHQILYHLIYIPYKLFKILKILNTHFQNTILFEHICLPCAFCGRLLYPTKAKWIPYDESYNYPLEMNFPNINVYTIGEDSACTTCVCNSCKNSKKKYPCPQLHSIPDVIKAIP